jgi:hypothetical protein
MVSGEILVGELLRIRMLMRTRNHYTLALIHDIHRRLDIDLRQLRNDRVSLFAFVVVRWVKRRS